MEKLAKISSPVNLREEKRREAEVRRRERERVRKLYQDESNLSS